MVWLPRYFHKIICENLKIIKEGDFSKFAFLLLVKPPLAIKDPESSIMLLYTNFSEGSSIIGGLLIWLEVEPGGSKN